MKNFEDELHRRGLLDSKHRSIGGGGNEDGFYTATLDIERCEAKDSEFIIHKLGEILGGLRWRLRLQERFFFVLDDLLRQGLLNENTL
jgi:hypothetical protein